MHKAPTRDASAPVADKLPLQGSNLRNSPTTTIAWKHWIVVLKAKVAGTKACIGRSLRAPQVKANYGEAEYSDGQGKPTPNETRIRILWGIQEANFIVMKTFSKEKASAAASGSATPRNPNPDRAI